MAGADKALLKQKIADFCELDMYLDYPTKTYSSEMLSRLLSAIAIFQPFELLLIDEVLAVGDALFHLNVTNKFAKYARQAERSSS